LCSYVFWQISAPLIRYGYAYVLLVDFLMLGWIFKQLGWHRIQVILYFALLLYGTYKIFAVGKYIYDTRYVSAYVHQVDYGQYEMNTYVIEDITFYYPKAGALTGYDYFPAAPAEHAVELRGAGLEDGFR